MKRKIKILDTGVDIELEDAILRFALSMEKKFDKTGRGNTYLFMRKRDLFYKFLEEFSELTDAIRHNSVNKDEECVDVALVSMMLKENSEDFR